MLGQVTQYIIVNSVSPWYLEDVNRRGISIWFSTIVPSTENQNGTAYGSNAEKCSLGIDKAGLFPSQGIYEAVGFIRNGKFKIESARLLFGIDENLLQNLLKKAG